MQLLRGGTGLPFTISAVAALEGTQLPLIDASQVLGQNVAPEIVEKSVGVKYPTVYVYCSGLSNQLKEKFRTFSGKAHMAVEVRVSHDRLEGVTENMQLYSAAVTEVLDSQRGDWGGGMFYTGGYTVEFQPIKQGGKNFLQTAKIAFDVEMSY